ncbi:MAG: EMC3/TMCO1 family protein [Thermoplasmataceae archaeon]
MTEQPKQAVSRNQQISSAQAQAMRSQTTFMMIYMVITMFSLIIITDTTLRNLIGSAMSYVLVPLIGFHYSYPLITIVLVGVLIGLITSIPRYFFTDWVRMGRMQQRMRHYNKLFQEAYRNNQRDKIQKLNKIRSEMSIEQMQLSMNTTKPLIVLTFFTLLLFAWVYYFISHLSYQIVAFPWDYNINIASSHISVMPYWVPAYFFSSLVVGYFATMIIKYFDFTFKLRKMGPKEVQSNADNN